MPGLTRLEQKIIKILIDSPRRKIEFWQVVKACGYISDVLKALENLKQQKFIKLENSEVSPLSQKISAPPVGGWPKKFPSLKEIMKKYLHYRKEVKFKNDDYDQLEILPQGIKNKLSLLLTNNDLRNINVVCLGDDDLFSITLSLTGLPKSITAIDIDDRLLNFLKKSSPKLPLPIRALKVDLLKSIPKNLQNKFDVLITEPPDTLKGAQIFLAQGIKILYPGGIIYLGLSETTLNQNQWRLIEKMMIDSGFVITDVLRMAEPYETIKDELEWRGFEKLPSWINKPPKQSWYPFTLFRMELTGPKKIPLVKINEKNIEKELTVSLLP